MEFLRRRGLPSRRAGGSDHRRRRGRGGGGLRGVVPAGRRRRLHAGLLAGRLSPARHARAARPGSWPAVDGGDAAGGGLGGGPGGRLAARSVERAGRGRDLGDGRDSTPALLLVLPLGFAFLASAVGAYPIALRLTLFAAPLVVCLVAAGVVAPRPGSMRRCPSVRTARPGPGAADPVDRDRGAHVVAHPRDEEMRPLVAALEARVARGAGLRLPPLHPGLVVLHHRLGHPDDACPDQMDRDAGGSRRSRARERREPRTAPAGRRRSV